MSSVILRETEAIRPWAALPLGMLGAGDLDGTPALPAGSGAGEELVAGARVQANEVIGGARAQAEALLRQAREEAEAIRAAAHREGLAAGHAEGLSLGREEARADLELERERLQGLRAGMTEAFAGFCTAQAPNLAAAAVACAERLLMEQLSLEPERVTEVVREALDCITAATEITVRLHPEDLPLVEGDAGLAFTPGVVRLAEDPRIARGGCRLESEQGEVDATVEGRLARLRETILNGDDC